jgi:hypothetical protein
MPIGMGKEAESIPARPGPLAREPGCSVEEGCITCGDVALDLEVVAFDKARGLALCSDEHGRRETVETALVAPVQPGDHLLVHAGTAIAYAAPPPSGTPGRAAEEVAGI